MSSYFEEGICISGPCLSEEFIANLINPYLLTGLVLGLSIVLLIIYWRLKPQTEQTNNGGLPQ